MTIYYKVKELGTFDPEYPQASRLNPNFIMGGSMEDMCGNVYQAHDTDFNSEKVQLDRWWFHLSWLIKGYMKDGEFVPAPDEEQYHQPTLLTQRSEWKPEYEKNLMIHKKVVDLIEKIVDRSVPLLSGYYGNFYKTTEQSYDFTWVMISQTNKKKLSGIAFNTLEASTWENTGFKAESTLDLNLKNSLFNNPPESYFREEKGTFLKPAKLIRALFPDLDETQVTSYAAKLQRNLRELANPNTSVVQVNPLPSEIYTHDEQCFDSCMKDQPKSWFKIYDDLKHTSIAYIEEDGMLKARALIHDRVFEKDNPEPFKIMDRIYSENEDYEVIMIEWAKEHGYYYKACQSACYYHFYKPDGTKIHKPEIYIECDDLVEKKYEGIPYMDTFCRYNHDYFVLSSYHKYNTYLQNTDGCDSNNFIVKSLYCQRCEYRSQELYEVRNYDYSTLEVCQDCLQEFYYCEECDEYHRPQNINDDGYCYRCRPRSTSVSTDVVSSDSETVATYRFSSTSSRWIIDEITSEYQASILQDITEEPTPTITAPQI